MKTIEEVIKKKEKCVWAITELQKLWEESNGEIIINQYDYIIQEIGGYNRKDREAEKKRADVRAQCRKNKEIYPFYLFITNLTKELRIRIEVLDWFLEE